ncbi:hypothetical protein ACFL21_04295 [Patescibacteria group bacterium]
MPDSNQNPNPNDPTKAGQVDSTPASTPPTPSTAATPTPPVTPASAAAATPAPAPTTPQTPVQAAAPAPVPTTPQTPAPPAAPATTPATPQTPTQTTAPVTATPAATTPAPAAAPAQTPSTPPEQVSPQIGGTPPQDIKAVGALSAASTETPETVPEPPKQLSIIEKIKQNSYLLYGLIAVAAIILIIIIVILFSGGGGGSQIANAPRPPDLSSGGNTLKGFIRTDQGFYQITKEDVDSFIGLDSIEDCTPIKLHAGLHYYHLDEPTSIDTLFHQRIEPILGNQMLISLYSPGESSLGLEPSYYTFPEGTFDGTKLFDISQTIPAKRGFILILKQSTYGCINSAEAPPQTPFSIPLADDESGWILLPVDKCADLNPFSNLITALYSQDGENSFTYGSITDCLNAEYHLNWLLVNTGYKPLPEVLNEEQAITDMEAESDISEDIIDDESLNLPDIVYLELSHNSTDIPLDLHQELIFQAYANVTASSNLEFRIFNINDLNSDHAYASLNSFDEDFYIFTETLIDVEPNDSSRQLEWDIDPEIIEPGEYVVFVMAQNFYGMSEVKFDEFSIIDSSEEEITEQEDEDEDEEDDEDDDGRISR